MAGNQGKGAIFDLDGTLLDSMGVWDQVDIDFLSKRGIDVPDDYMTKVAAMQFRQIAEYTIARFSPCRNAEETQWMSGIIWPASCMPQWSKPNRTHVNILLN